MLDQRTISALCRPVSYEDHTISAQIWPGPSAEYPYSQRLEIVYFAQVDSEYYQASSSVDNLAPVNVVARTIRELQSQVKDTIDVSSSCPIIEI